MPVQENLISQMNFADFPELVKAHLQVSFLGIIPIDVFIINLLHSCALMRIELIFGD